MVRPKRNRRIGKNPEIKSFNSQNKNTETIELIVDEFEAIRLKDYHNIKQKESAELMGISQPTFHRILNSARKKLAMALIEGKELIITGDEFMIDQIKYLCEDCGFQWSNPQKEYEECPDCKSKNIKILDNENITPQSKRKSFGGPGQKNCGFNKRGKWTKCKCPNCGYEHPKTRGIPCRNTLCPECGTPLCGFDENEGE